MPRTTSPAGSLGALAVVLAALLGCSDEASVCAAGSSRACDCPGGGHALQRCADDGARWAACDCAAADADADGVDGASEATDLEDAEDSEAEVDVDGPTDAPAGDGAEATAACPDPGPGTPDVPVSVAAGAPALSGGTIAEARYELTSVVFYPDGALDSSISGFAVHSDGNTHGAVVFREGAWGMSADFDLYLTMRITGVGAVELDLVPRFTLAGPATIADDAIATGPGACADLHPEDCGLGVPLRYQAESDAVQVELVWSQDCLVSLMPVEYALYARGWLEGDLPVVLRFSR
jgi:hypothetical protein